jgi:phosphoribosyl-ATP pyrophosphohydrolase
MTKILSDLFKSIQDKKNSQQGDSYTVKMLNSNSEKMMRKLCEEAIEVGLASIQGDGHKNGKEQIIYESADLVYHLFVLMAKNEVSLEDVEKELKSRMKND